MDNSRAYTSLAEAKENFVVEDGPYAVESPEYVDFSVTPPGEYLSTAREVKKVTAKPDGNVTFEIHLTGGVRTLDGATSYGTGQFPFRTWLSTKQFTQQGRPGTTSGVAQYLKEAGFDPKGFKTKNEVIEAVEQSLNIPLKVYIGLTDRGVKQPDGSYTNLNLKTKDFITGQNPDGTPIYSFVIEKDGVQVKATEKVGGFRSFA